MKAIKGIIVELSDKHLHYNGVDIRYDFVNKTADTPTFSGISIASDYNSPLWCPDRGVVTDSDDPQILVGDTVILDYFAVVRKLGEKIEQFQQRPEAVYEVVSGKVRIPVKTRHTVENYVYGVFRDGEFVEYNGFQVVEEITEKASDAIHTVRFDKVTQQYVDYDNVNRCVVLYGQYAGMTCLFNPSYLLGQAQMSLIDGKEVRFIQKEYLLAQITNN